jgi:ferric-dicitrate binding protein FerR (iron transport regulator)
MIRRSFSQGDQSVSITNVLVAGLLAAASACALATDARERGFISLGMAEGEVLFRIGKPDHEAFVLNVKNQPEEKTWTFFPHSRDPQTLTIITLRAGVVANVERKIAR